MVPHRFSFSRGVVSLYEGYSERVVVMRINDLTGKPLVRGVYACYVEFFEGSSQLKYDSGWKSLNWI
jgi:uncharacterized protein YqhQ